MPNVSLPIVRVVAALVEREGRYLITQRRAEASLPLLWEFPGGRVEAGESDLQALRRELDHRLGVEVEVRKLVSFVRHPYERYQVELYLYDCSLVGAAPRARAVHAFAWASSAELDHYPFTAADEVSVSSLLGLG